MKTILKSKYRLLGITSLVLLVLGLFFFVQRRPNPPVKENWHAIGDGISDIRVFGDQQQFVTFKGAAQVSQNYVVSEEFKIREKNIRTNHYEKGDYYRLVLYDLRTPNFKKRKIDFYKALQDYDSQYAITHNYHTISYQGRDYIGFGVARNDGRDKKILLLDLETEKVQALPRDLDYLEYADKFNTLMVSGYYTSLYKAIESQGILVVHWALNLQNTALADPKLNFAKENPEIAQLIEKEEIKTIYFRKGQVTYDSLFQDLRHLLAPVGQNKLEVIATYPPTGEIRAVESYQEYREWEKEVRKFEEGQAQ